MKKFLSIFRGIKGKLSWIILTTVLAIGIEGWIAIHTVNFQAASLKTMSHELADKLNILNNIDSQGNEAMRYTWASINGNDLELRKQRIEKSKSAFSELMDRFKELEKSHPADFAKVAQSKEIWTEVIGHVEKSFALTTEGKVEEAADNINKHVSKRAVEASAVLEKYLKEWEEEFYSVEASTNKEAAVKMTILYLVIGVGLLLNVSVVFYLGYSLTKNLKVLSDRVMQSGSQVLSASTQLSSASQGLSSGSTESASSLEETVSSLEELSSTVKMNSDNAREAASLAGHANKAAEEGDQEISKLIKAMDEIATGSKKIEEIISVIDDIAFQTNLLALNAAVEAARAGEQGKGFAVVADAVRALAQRSAAAAKDISNLIRESVEKSNHGSEVASQSGVVLKNIVSSIKKVSDLNNEISEAGLEQSRGIAQISKAMNELDETTQRNAASAEEVAASSEELSAQSQQMHELVKDLEKIVTGSEDESSIKKASATEKRDEKTKKSKFELVKSDVQSAKPHAKEVASKSSSKAEDVIPFDDDVEPMKKVGTTDGF